MSDSPAHCLIIGGEVKIKDVEQLLEMIYTLSEESNDFMEAGMSEDILADDELDVQGFIESAAADTLTLDFRTGWENPALVDLMRYMRTARIAYDYYAYGGEEYDDELTEYRAGDIGARWNVCSKQTHEWLLDFTRTSALVHGYTVNAEHVLKQLRKEIPNGRRRLDPLSFVSVVD